MGSTGIAFANAGSGADRVEVITAGADVSVTLGTGRDLLVLPANALGTGDFGLTIVRDFEVGPNGDKIDLGSALAGYLQNYTAGSNPFASGHLRLIDFFGNAYLQIDRDGASGSEPCCARAGAGPSRRCLPSSLQSLRSLRSSVQATPAPGR